MSFEKLDFIEVRIYFEESIANFFVNDCFEIKTQYTSVGNFSKGFYWFFSINFHFFRFRPFLKYHITPVPQLLVNDDPVFAQAPRYFLRVHAFLQIHFCHN